MSASRQPIKQYREVVLLLIGLLLLVPAVSAQMRAQYGWHIVPAEDINDKELELLQELGSGGVSTGS